MKKNGLMEEFGKKVENIEFVPDETSSGINRIVGPVGYFDTINRYWRLRRTPILCIPGEYGKAAAEIIYKKSSFIFFSVRDAEKAIELFSKRRLTKRKFDFLIRKILEGARDKEIKRLKGL